MRWTREQYPKEFENLEAEVKEQAIEIANRLLVEKGYSEQRAISTAMAQAQDMNAPGATMGNVVSDKIEEDELGIDNTQWKRGRDDQNEVYSAKQERANADVEPSGKPDKKTGEPLTNEAWKRGKETGEHDFSGSDIGKERLPRDENGAEDIRSNKDWKRGSDTGREDYQDKDNPGYRDLKSGENGKREGEDERKKAPKEDQDRRDYEKEEKEEKSRDTPREKRNF